MKRTVLLFLTLALGAAAHGQEQPVVRAEIKPATVAVGESAELTVTVLVPTWFVRPPVYPSFELSNAITRRPADGSYNIRERVGNESWSGIVRTFEVLPLLGASYRLDGQSMSVAYANPGAEASVVDVSLPAVEFRGAVPAGAESLEPYIAGTSLKLGLDVDGDLNELEAGGAIVLNYRAELDGLPAIFLPPLVPDLEFDGVSVYRDAPDVRDGESARRDEKLTLVFDTGGDFSVPDIELSFWNTSSQSIETVTATGFGFSVAGPRVEAAPDDAPGESRWLQNLGWFAAAFVFVAFLWRLMPTVARRYRDAAAARRQSEGFALKQLVQALDAGRSESAYSALLLWLARLAPGMTTRDFASDYADETLREAVDALSAGIYGPTERSGNPGDIKRKLKAARSLYLASQLSRRDASLPPLNP